MNKVIQFASRHPWGVLLPLLAITLLAVTKLERLSINISAQSMMLRHDPAREFHDRVVSTFGSDNSIIVFLSDPALFSRENFSAIQQSLKQIESLPFIQRTLSLFSAKNVKSVEGYITNEGYLDKLPVTQEEAERIKAEALKNPLIVRNLLSADGTAMAINIHLGDREQSSTADQALVQAIERAIAPLSGRLEQAFQIGSPYVRQAITEKIRVDQQITLPLALAVLVVTLALSLRRIAAAFIPLLTAGCSVIWTLALMAVLEIPLNVMTSIVPALLVIIGSTEDVHMLSEYYTRQRSGQSVVMTLDRMGERMGTPIMLSFITTYLGFLSIAINDIELLQQFGLVASTGLLFNFLITVLLLPASLRLLGKKSGSAGESASRPVPYRRMAERLFEAVRSHRRVTVVLVLLAAVISLYGAGSLRVNNNPMDYFAKDSALSIRSTTLHERLSGMQTFSIVVSSGIEGTFLKRRYLDELVRLQKYLKKAGTFDKSFSFADYIALVHTVMEEESSGEVYLPESDDIVREYMLFIKHGYVAPYVSEDFSQARIVVRHNIGSSYQLREALEELHAFAAEQTDPGLEVAVSGESILTNHAADYMASGQAKSLALMILVIWLVVSLLFVNSKAGIIAVIPNLFPIVVLFGTMGFADIPLDTGTAMVAAIALGVCVDDTMHFMARYHHYSKREGDAERALRLTVREEALPVTATSVALALGFAVLATSGFPPVVYFGLLSSMVILLALFSTFVILPILLSKTQLITMWDLLSLRLRTSVLERCDLFRGMRQWQIRKTILLSDVREFAPAELIVKQGDAGEEMFILLDGEVEVWKNHPDGARTLTCRLNPGQVFGEMALITDSPRTADVIAAGPTQVLALKWEGVHRITGVFPRIASKLFQNLSAILSHRLAKSLDRIN